jgi:hypothetical protein
MSANTLAAILVALTGKPAHAICAHCLMVTDPHEQYSARAVPSGGDCELCSYSDEGNVRRSGLSDMFVSLNPNLPQCPVQALTVAIVERKLAGIGSQEAA